jgi:hypothetical protein
MTDFKTGWIPGVSNHDHHRGIYKPCIGSSMVKVFVDRSPAHVKQMQDFPKIPTEIFLFGDQFHRYALEYDVGNLVVVPKIDKRTTKGKLLAAELAEKYKDKTMVSQPNYDNMQGMVAALHRHPISKKLMQFKDREITGIFQDFGTDLWCKIRPDLIDHEQKIIVDLKSTVDASYDKFNRDIFKFGYHVSAAWYKYGAEQITGNRYAFIIAAVEKSPPYGINCFNIGGLAVRKAWDKISEHLGDLSDCVINDKWPNYKPFLHEPDVPAWII